MLDLINRRLNSFVLLVQGAATVFCALFISVYLLGLRDLPDNVVYHADPTFRTVLSAFGVVVLILVVLAIIFSFVAKRRH